MKIFNFFKKLFAKKEKPCCGCKGDKAVETPVKTDKKEELSKIIEDRVREIEESSNKDIKDKVEATEIKKEKPADKPKKENPKPKTEKKKPVDKTKKANPKSKTNTKVKESVKKETTKKKDSKK
jgi:hypothetical protein